MPNKKIKDDDSKGFRITVFVLLLILVVLCLFILHRLPERQKEKFSYEYITLNDDNYLGADYLVNGVIVDYMCSDNVEVHFERPGFFNHNGWFYASTWKDGKEKHSLGYCMIKKRLSND